jgi:hypothetical protein
MTASTCFTTPAEDLVAALRQRVTVVEDEDGSSYVAPDLLLSLWRPDAEDGHFEGVLVARPGYYD